MLKKILLVSAVGLATMSAANGTDGSPLNSDAVIVDPASTSSDATVVNPPEPIPITGEPLPKTDEAVVQDQTSKQESNEDENKENVQNVEPSKKDEEEKTASNNEEQKVGEDKVEPEKKDEEEKTAEKKGDEHKDASNKDDQKEETTEPAPEAKGDNEESKQGAAEDDKKEETKVDDSNVDITKKDDTVVKAASIESEEKPADATTLGLHDPKATDADTETKPTSFPIWGIGVIAGGSAALLSLITFGLVRRSTANKRTAAARRALGQSPV